MKINEVVGKGHKQITEIPLIPAAVVAGGAAWTAYDAYRYGKQYKAGKITKDELIKRIGVDAALTLIGGAATKTVNKAVTPIIKRRNFKVIDGGSTNRKIPNRNDKFNRPLNEPTRSKKTDIDEITTTNVPGPNKVKRVNTGVDMKAELAKRNAQISSPGSSTKFNNRTRVTKNSDYNTGTSKKTFSKYIQKTGDRGGTSLSKVNNFTSTKDGTTGTSTKRYVKPGGAGTQTVKNVGTGKITRTNFQLKGPQTWAYDKPK